MIDRPEDRLVDRYDLIVCDLDGVVYLVDRPIPSAVEAIIRLRAEGRALAYATNNASRRAPEVADLLTGLGVPARSEEVSTSAAAAAEVLADRLLADSPVLVVGAEALRAEVREVGLSPVTQAADDPVAVVQGYASSVGWGDLAEATVAIRTGALWVATNTDRTLPSPRGPLPGNGALVAVLRTALDRDPDVVVGKPQPALFRTAVRRAAASRPLVVGDRLDTDIEGAVRAGIDSLLVFTGVNTPGDLLLAPVETRPTYVAWDLGGLFSPEAVVRVPVGAGEACGDEWCAADEGGEIVLTGRGRTLEALAVVCGAFWAGPPGTGRVRAGSAAALAALRDLGLPA